MMYRFVICDKVKLEEVRLYIAAHPHLPLRMEELCSRALMNRHKLNEGFQRFYGKKVGKYIEAVRMQRAQELLQTTDDNMAAIAEACGYGYAGNFCTAYKRYYGCTPVQERRKAGDDVATGP